MARWDLPGGETHRLKVRAGPLKRHMTRFDFLNAPTNQAGEKKQKIIIIIIGCLESRAASNNRAGKTKLGLTGGRFFLPF